MKKLNKSMYKASYKAIADKKTVKDITDDIADPDNIAEVDPKEVNTNKQTSIMNKCGSYKQLKTMGKSEKGLSKLKLFLEIRKNKNL